MRGPTLRQIAIPLVVLMVALAGCSGGGGGDGGDATPTATATDAGGAGATATATATDGGGDTATTTQETTTTAGDTPTATATSDPGTSTPGSGDGFSAQRHASGLREAGSYTIEYTIDGLFGGGGQSSNTVLRGTEMVELDTGERYASVTSSSDGQEYTLEYYQPPGSETVYQHVAGQTRETTSDQALLFNFASINSSGVGQFPELRNAGTAQTDLGPATKYVVDSVEQLPDSTRDQYGSIENVSFVVFVDKDTGVIAKYDYRLTYVQETEQGQEQETTVRFVIEVTDLGSTTVEAPEWAPES